MSAAAERLPPFKSQNQTVMLSWYLVKLIYFAAAETIGSGAKFEERYMMLQADEAGWAREKAVVLARLQEHTLAARFVQVAEVVELTEYEGACLIAPQAEEITPFAPRVAAR
jgi:hypothetical protein